MFIRLNKTRAQSTVEYAVIIGVFASALIFMQGYLRRALQGKMKSTADWISETHYSPDRNFSSDIAVFLSFTD